MATFVMILECVFVYGTLRLHPRLDAAGLLRGRSEFVGFATVQGRLYDLGPFPGAVPSDRPEDHVVGEVHRLSDPDTTFTLLDDYEGCGEAEPGPHLFRREVVVATLETGAHIECAVYWYVGATSGKRLIPTGDYSLVRSSESALPPDGGHLSL